MFSDKLQSLRKKVGISQEKLAAILNVSRQAVQKWETGVSMPDIDNLKALSNFFNVTVDHMLFGEENRSVEELRVGISIEPVFDKWHNWEAYYRMLPTEYRQCVDEGKKISSYETLFKAVAAMPDGKHKSDLSDILFNIVQDTPLDENYPYVEPSDLETILSCTDGNTYDLKMPDRETLEKRIAGAYYGRVCGCLLGKPVEGMKFPELTSFLERTGNSPMYRYIVKSDCDKADFSDQVFQVAKTAYPDENMDAAPMDDDTNYVVLAYKLLDRYGRDFTPDDMMDNWINSQIKNAYCTAERVAYRNFVNGFRPPESAVYKNPYREWIGAQIRGDFFGWINPADPKTAADMAWRDACISHVKNGIYGEMWVAAMLAGAAAGADVEQSIRIGMSYIPVRSRLYEALDRILVRYHEGVTVEECFADFHRRWSDAEDHDWVHTIPNAEIVAASLLYSGNDYGKAVCLAVEQAFDTDCNGATVGSVMGMILGVDNIPAQWKDKIGGKFHSSLFGFDTIDIDQMAKDTLRFIPNM